MRAAVLARHPYLAVLGVVALATLCFALLNEWQDAAWRTGSAKGENALLSEMLAGARDYPRIAEGLTVLQRQAQLDERSSTLFKTVHGLLARLSLEGVTTKAFSLAMLVGPANLLGLGVAAIGLMALLSARVQADRLASVAKACAAP